MSLVPEATPHSTTDPARAMPAAVPAPKWRVPVAARLEERLSRALIAGESLSRVAGSWTKRAAVDVVGSYNTGNVGDRSFAWCIQRVADSLQTAACLQDWSRFGQYRPAGPLVLGGGGLNFGLGNLRRWARARLDARAGTSIIGVSTTEVAQDLDEDVRTFLTRARFISVRDPVSQRALEAAVGRRVELQPDIVMGLLELTPELRTLPERDGVPTLGVNLNPVLATRRKDIFAPNSRPSPWFAAHLPETAKVYAEIAPAYVRLARFAIQKHLERGWRVLVIPFAPEDATFSRAVLGDLPVEFVKFDVHPARVFTSVARCTSFLATRFHAHVFALLANVPLWSLPYSDKCNHLLQQITGTDHDMSPITWVNDSERCEHYLCDETARVALSPQLAVDLGRQAVAATRQGVLAALERV